MFQLLALDPQAQKETERLVLLLWAGTPLLEKPLAVIGIGRHHIRELLPLLGLLKEDDLMAQLLVRQLLHFLDMLFLGLAALLRNDAEDRLTWLTGPD